MYSEALIKEVKECYPDNKEIHKLADEGSPWLGRYLDDACGVISVDTILIATTLEELQVKARFLKRKMKCYNMWYAEDPRKKSM